MPLKLVSVVEHYDRLVDEGNDPYHDPAPLRQYMDNWDGEAFIDAIHPEKSTTILEIGVGTGRLAARVAPRCKRLLGIDVSPKAIVRASENLASHRNVDLICGDFLTQNFSESFDVIYSSLTFMHIKEKATAIGKAASLLASGGRLVLSIDKSQATLLDFKTRCLLLYPDTPQDILRHLRAAELVLSSQLTLPNAFVFVASKR